MHIHHISDPGDLEHLAGPWNELSGDAPFRTWDWQEAWWRNYGGTEAPAGEGALFVVAARHGHHIHGIAPMFRQGSAWSGRTLRFLGTGEVCSDYLGMVATPGREGAFAKALAEWLNNEARGEWDHIELEQVDGDDPTVRAFVDAMASNGAVVDWQPGAPCWRIELPGSWDEYLAGLSRSHRKQLRRLDRETFGAGRARLHTVRTEAEFETAFGHLVTLHQKRQQSLERAGCFASAQFLGFHAEAARRLLDRGRLRMHWLELDGRPVAADYLVAGEGGLFAYQTGIDPDALGESPGQLAMLAIIRAAIADGYRFVDLMRGLEGYKSHWRAASRPMATVRVSATRWMPMTRHCMEVFTRMMRSMVRGCPAALPIPEIAELGEVVRLGLAVA